MNDKDEIMKCKAAFAERNSHVNSILQSESSKKVVVAGPGTGKTFLFKKVLVNKNKCLTLTFVNSLVEDLSLELYGMSEVKTLHSYARSILKTHTKKNIKISPILSKIIKEDALILLNENVDFDRIFREIDEENDFINFYKKRKNYYDYYGYDDVIYAAVKHFELHKDKIPTYDQILVDEFQDFNKLEVTLIDILAEKSPILLTGDDDQALYEFKNASTQFIRDRTNGTMNDYESFNLPYCSRCTRVIVDAANDIINFAKNNGYVSERIDKPYTYFEDLKKNKESNTFVKISYSQIFAKQIPWYIEKKIKEMAEQVKNNFSVLIISPYKKQSNEIACSLKEKGLQNIDTVIHDELNLSLLDGIKLLLNNNDDRLGWRIVAKNILDENEFKSLLQETESNPLKKISDLLRVEQKVEIKKILRVLKYIRDNKSISNDLINETIVKLEIDSHHMIKEYLKKEINSTGYHVVDPGIIKIPIKSTTIQSSKGLAADLVFITHFDDRYFIKDNNKTVISDNDICKFLVSITRTKRKLYLISTVSEEPTFLQWINRDRIEILTC